MARGDSDPKEQFSARLRSRTLAHLRRRADRAGESQTALADRYIEEGLRVDEHPRIFFRDGAAGRRPALIGTRLDVWQVVETIRENDNSIAATADYLGIAPSNVEACVGYYAEYQDEIDEWVAREHEEAERAEISWRRRREIFA
jgi:uncharacterized protein (DUF433 family)